MMLQKKGGNKMKAEEIRQRLEEALVIEEKAGFTFLAIVGSKKRSILSYASKHDAEEQKKMLIDSLVEVLS